MLSASALAGGAWWQLVPRPQGLALPSTLIAIDTPPGQARLLRASARAGYDELAGAWQPQALNSWCGVASGAAALGALGRGTSQRALLDGAASGPSGWEVTVSGMTLEQLARLLEGHGLVTELGFARALGPEGFRERLVRSLRSEGEVALLNYARGPLGQVGSGHISPVGAYDAVSDSFLVMDTASHKYPWVWVEAAALYGAASTTDPDSGRSRGLLLVRRVPN